MFYRQHKPVSFSCGTEQITKQSHKAECDINTILSQYKKTGIINHIQKQQPLYTDLPSNIDYQQSMNTIIQAQDTFAALPATVRDRFSNDPERFLAAFSDPEMQPFLREYGFLQPLPPPSIAASPEASGSKSTAEPAVSPPSIPAKA